jgi:TolB-like protein/DNA-binding SARP family transcriptional activator/Tfp pilus assembly protein PilF
VTPRVTGPWLEVALIRLLLLGSASISAAGASALQVLAQPKRLGLLSYLAVAHPRGFHRRDALLPLFWPELDQRRARAALRQALYVLQRALGAGVILRRGTEEVGLNAERLWCDAVAFEEAIGGDRLEVALGIYRGDLLAGYHLPGASRELEDWIDAERNRLRRAAAEAARRLATEAESAGDPRRAAEWVLRELEHSPLNEMALRSRLVLLDRAGDRATACAEYEGFAGRLRAELGLEPSPETESIIAGIRARQRSRSEAGAVAVGRADPAVTKPTTAPAEAEQRERGGSRLEEAIQPGRGGPGREARTSMPRRRSLALSALTAIPLAAALVWAAAGREGAAPEIPRADPRTVAVLPFEEPGRAPGEGYLAAGLTAELTAALSSARELVVLAPVLSPDVLGRDTSLPELGARIDAAHLLRGTVRADGDRLRVIAELVHAQSGTVIWAEAYDRRRADLLSLQGDLATGITAALRARLTADERHRIERPPTGQPAAYDLYLGARELVARSAAANRAAIDMLRKAIELDPTFAAAHAALANAFLHRVQMGIGAEWADSGVAAARRALELDAGLAEGYRELGANQSWQGRLAEAEESFRRAVAVKPSYGEAFRGLGVTVAWQGRLDEALQHYERAYRLIPGSGTTSLQIGVVFLGFEQYAEAERWLTHALDLAPASGLTLQLLTLLELARGDPVAARARSDLLLALDSRHHRAVNAAADVALYSGRTAEARRHLERFHAAAPDAYAGGTLLSPYLRLGYALLQEGETNRGKQVLRQAETMARTALERGDQRYSVPLELAAVHAVRGETESAVQWFEAAVSAGFRLPVLVELLPLFGPLRGDSRYESIVTAVRTDVGHMASRITPTWTLEPPNR